MEKNNLKSLYSSIPGANVMANRLKVRGGSVQQDRMIKDKRETLDRAVLYSYQGAKVKKIGENQEIALALINPNKLKPDYDDKILSIGHEYGYQSGDIFEWMGTNTNWLIYLQDLTELAYFRGDIRKCSYKIKWQDGDRECSTYAAIRGPVETKVNFIQKHGISIDNPNYTLNILMPKNEDTLKYFKRYSKFYLADDSEKVCWKVVATDWVSTPGILEVNAIEYYANETEDNVEEGIVGGMIMKPIEPEVDADKPIIDGEAFIKVKKTYEYIFTGEEDVAGWSIDARYPVLWEIDSADSRKISLKWNATYGGQFEIKYGDCIKTVVAESLF